MTTPIQPNAQAYYARPDGRLAPAGMALFQRMAERIGALEAAPGGVQQVVQVAYSSQTFSNSASWVDIAGASVTITPNSVNSSVLVMFHQQMTMIASSYASGARKFSGGLRLLRGDTPIYTQGAGNTGDNNLYFHEFRINAAEATISEAAISLVAPVTFLDAPATSAAVTYKLQVFVTSGGVFANLAGYGGEPNQINSESQAFAIEVADA